MAQLKIGRMVLGVCTTNCYFLYREGEQDAIVVDPANNGEQIYCALSERQFVVKGILLTHGHFDHILGANKLRELSGAKIYALEEEKALCEDAALNLSAQFGRAEKVTVDVYVKDEESITIGDMTCKVIATPGHTEGSCCFYFEEDGFLVCGDTVFLESVGRTDFPTGSSSRLIRSIKEKILTLPEETKLYPGHGDGTTVAHEKEYNPFC